MKKSKPKIIDLKPEETGILSLIADYAGNPALKSRMEEALAKTTPRARAIGRIMLNEPEIEATVSSHALMARRFLDAKRNYDAIMSKMPR